MKKRIICMILSLVAVFSFFGFEATQTWFATGENKIQSLKPGVLNFTLGDLPTSENKYLPGDVIDTSDVEVTNTSNIDTKVRIKFSFTDGDDTERDSGLITPVFADESKWTDSGDGYYVYNDIIKAGENMPFVSSIELNGELIDNEFNGEIVEDVKTYKSGKIKITFEAVQAHYNDEKGWTVLGSVTV